MNCVRLLFAFCAAAMLTMGACSPNNTADSGPAAKREVSVEVVAAQAKGFTVGAIMSTATVYVFFDTQCPHCGHLWNAAMPLHKKLKFVWIPIGMINASSTSQGAALLTAVNPLDLMNAHETALLAGQGGMAATSSVPADIEAAIKANTRLFNSFGAESVPFIVTKNLVSGQTVSRAGALNTAALADFVGLAAAP